MLDGNSAPSSRLLPILKSDSLVIWQQTQWQVCGTSKGSGCIALQAVGSGNAPSSMQEFYYAGLRPYVHYLPLNWELTDLYDRIEWAKANDGKCFSLSLCAAAVHHSMDITEPLFQPRSRGKGDDAVSPDIRTLRRKHR